MPKQKTKKSAAKRFRMSARGKLKYQKPGRRHLMSSKSRGRKRSLRHPGVLSAPETRRIKYLIGK